MNGAQVAAFQVWEGGTLREGMKLCAPSPWPYAALPFILHNKPVIVSKVLSWVSHSSKLSDPRKESWEPWSAARVRNYGSLGLAIGI